MKNITLWRPVRAFPFSLLTGYRIAHRCKKYSMLSKPLEGLLSIGILQRISHIQKTFRRHLAIKGLWKVFRPIKGTLSQEFLWEVFCSWKICCSSSIQKCKRHLIHAQEFYGRRPVENILDTGGPQNVVLSSFSIPKGLKRLL